MAKSDPPRWRNISKIQPAAATLLSKLMFVVFSLEKKKDFFADDELKMFMLLHDWNKDGAVSFAEFSRHKWRPYLAETTIVRFLHRLDRDRDGAVSEEEFNRSFPFSVWSKLVPRESGSLLYPAPSAQFFQMFFERWLSTPAYRVPRKTDEQVPEDFFLGIHELKDHVQFIGSANGTGTGFLLIDDANEESFFFAGSFRDFRRDGCGVTCCVRSEEEEIPVRHTFFNDSNYEAIQPLTAVEAACSFQYFAIAPGGVRLLTSSSLQGLGLLVWEDGSVYAGLFENGKRSGDGLYLGSDGNSLKQTWGRDEDTLTVLIQAQE